VIETLNGSALSSVPAGVEDPVRLEEVWKEESRALTIRHSRALCLIAMSLVPFCTVLDYFQYPQHWWLFFQARAAVSGIEIVLLLLSYTAWGNKHYRMLMLLVPLVPAMLIAWMIYASGDPASPYYAGLTLCLVGVGLLYQWSHVESIIAVAITILLYLAATLPLVFDDKPDASFGAFVNNGVFLIANSVVIVTGSLVHFRIRKNEVIARHRLAENRKELEQKNLQLVEADRMKTDFFSNITHELRTPLTLMIAPLQRLQRLYPPEDDGAKGLNQELGGIYDNALRLLKLINNLLDLASADAGRIRVTRQQFSLGEFTGRLLHSVNNMAQQGGVAVKRRADANIDLVSADQDKMEKILLNLLFNAVKFTPTGGSVTLATRERPGQVIFEVIDTGVGISEQHLPFIFDRFWQADSSATRRHPGTGLGLALVKEFVEKMGGHLVARSQLGKGTTIEVHLPIEKNAQLTVIGAEIAGKEKVEESPDHQEPASEAAAIQPKSDEVPDVKAPEKSGSAAWIQSVYREAERVESRQATASPGAVSSVAPVLPSLDHDGMKPLLLVVDDDAGMLRFMRTELEANYRVIEASDGESALHLVESHQPDLVVSDYMMPNLDGLSFCRILRNRPESRMTPVMLVTARSDEEVRLTALRNGANDVLIKPFSLTEFHTRIHNLVHAGILQKQLEVRNAELVRTLEELRAAERDLIQSEKMASLGILTGGIMHEINNPLNFARSALYVLQRKTGKLGEEKRVEFGDVLTDIGESISRISAIISDLRTFCHPESAMASSCPIVEPLQAAVRILAAPLKEARIELRENVLPDLLVRGDRNQLTLVFLNLIKNAVDALAAIEPADRIEFPMVWISARLDGQVLEVCVKDNGPGIPEDNLARVFDPFFTTKPAGEGTGLGLSMCYRIITAHGGAINVFSGAGKGTEFVLRIPAAVPEPRPREEVEELALTS
jgi:signal transduction histidine kinase